MKSFTEKCESTSVPARTLLFAVTVNGRFSTVARLSYSGSNSICDSFEPVSSVSQPSFPVIPEPCLSDHVVVLCGRAQKLVDGTGSVSSEIRLLQPKIEIYRRRAGRSAITKIGRVAYQSAAQRWRRFVAWLRYNTLYIRLPKRGKRAAPPSGGNNVYNSPS